MKYFYFLALVLLIFSCEKTENTNDLLDDNIDFRKVESLKSMDEASQKNAFRLLNPSEQYYFRELIIDQFINTNDLTLEQLKIIDELRDGFTKEVVLSKDARNYFLTIFVTEWSNKATKYFTIQEIAQFATGPFLNDAIPVSQFRSQSDCSCHEDGSWGCLKQIEVGFEGPMPVIKQIRVPCSSPYACNIPRDENGDYETEGCGWLWQQICDGSC